MAQSSRGPVYRPAFHLSGGKLRREVKSWQKETLTPQHKENSPMLQEIVSDLNLVIKSMMVMAEEFGLEPKQTKTLVTAILNLVDRASYNTMMFMALESGLKPNQARIFLDACIGQMHECANLHLPDDTFLGFEYAKTVHPRRK